ncbi:MAG: prealbumin-like fold domain-containing protein [Solobacterium sp.]|jgi:hypothetical protein|nr:prealbumin-like fold domain-containing protein [Solobacterium sp.]MCH4206266.1 prealbumin-like fold domain-containing protein [Solobacterium sp.]MCH4227697.1 prealbumin-like fold domain-containing protein [Solobacterium sp.]MCH4283124.1 prealbumin-like fold domain-containing protein [Solobacterium sp.]
MMMKKKNHFVLRIIALAFSVALASGTTSAVHAEDAETGTFILHLYDLTNDQAITGIGFDVAATGKEDTAAVTINGKVTLTGKTDASGDLAVKNLPIGTYSFKIQEDTIPTYYEMTSVWYLCKSGNIVLQVVKNTGTGKIEAYLQNINTGASSSHYNETEKTYLYLYRKQAVINVSCKDVQGNTVVGRIFDVVLNEAPKNGIAGPDGSFYNYFRINYNFMEDKNKYDGKYFFPIKTGEDGIASASFPFAHYSVYEEAPATAATSYVPGSADISEVSMKQAALDGTALNIDTLVSSLAEGTVTFQTADAETGSPIKGTSFSLSGKVANGVVLDDNSGQRMNGASSLTGTTDDSGNLNIASLGLGTYTLTETIPAGYQLHENEIQRTYTIAVTEDEAQKGIAKVTVTDASGTVSKNINHSIYKISYTSDKAADPVTDTTDDYEVVNTAVK